MAILVQRQASRGGEGPRAHGPTRPRGTGTDVPPVVSGERRRLPSRGTAPREAGRRRVRPMRILVVGAGGVGSAFAPIAARRDFYEHIVFTDIDESKARRIVDRYGSRGRFSAARSTRPTRRRSPTPSERTIATRPERGRPTVRDAGLPRGARGRRHLHGHGHVALGAAPERPYEETGEEARGRPVRDGASGRIAGRSPGRASASSPARPTCSLATRRTTSSTGSTRSGCVTAPTSRSRATTSRPRSRSGPRSRNA